MQHITTPRFRAAAELGSAPGAQPAGPVQNAVAQGQCTFDVAAGVVSGMIANAGPIAATATALSLGGAAPAALASSIVGTAVTTAQAAFDAYNASPACQVLDNAALANELGLGAIQAP